jgi:glutamine synthetase
MSAPRPGGPGGTAGMLSLDELRDHAQRGTIDTVLTAFTDMQGRLIGKRIEVHYFVEEGIEGCDYLLALDMEMDPVPGYEMANWEKGYGDFGIKPDLATLRQVPWLDRTALVLCDVVDHHGSPVAASPRQVLIAQYERAHEMGFTPLFASELEFFLYKESYAQADEQDFRNLTPTIPYILDYATESWAPTSISWGRDNRTCGFRVVGHRQSRRAECRIPGADVNPYLGYAALLAAGLDGIANRTDPGPELVGNAYEAAHAEPFPATLREAVELWEGSEFAKTTFGEAAWRHYLNYGRTEQRLFDQVVTDYERRRMFERG